MGDRPYQVRRRGCAHNQRLSKVTFLAMLPDNTKEYFEGLSDSDWEIYSFNVYTREACVQLHAPSGDRMVSYILPAVTWS